MFLRWFFPKPQINGGRHVLRTRSVPRDGSEDQPWLASKAACGCTTARSTTSAILILKLRSMLRGRAKKKALNSCAAARRAGVSRGISRSGRSGKVTRNLACLSNAAISIVRLRAAFRHQPQAYRHYAARQGEALREVLNPTARPSLLAISTRRPFAGPQPANT